MNQLHILDHPLITHKLTMMRDERTNPKDFRELLSEIALLMGYELTRDLPMEDITIETPITKMKAKMISGKKLAIVPILRAGLGMVSGIEALVPTAKIGHIGLYRDEKTLTPVEYYCKLPEGIEDKLVLVIDPMLATGGSAIDAIKLLQNRGVKRISFICIIAAPEGVKAFKEAYPDVPLYIGSLDRELNENAYICPGLGDCGDRIYGTVDE